MVRRKRTLQCRPTFDPHISILTLHPGITQPMLDAILKAEPHGIVLRTFGQGMLAESLFPWLREVTRADIPVLITSQALRIAIDLRRFRKQLTLERLGVISGRNMTYECAAAKMMWVLGQTQSPKKLRDLLGKNLVGEMDD